MLLSRITIYISLLIKRYLLFLLIIISSFIVEKSYSQVGSYGNTFVFSNAEFAIHDKQLNFQLIGNTQLSGIIGTERNIQKGYVSFIGKANHQGAANEAHIDGYVKSYISGQFTFPIGDNGNYQPAAVSLASFLNPSDAAYYAINPSTPITSSLKGGNEPPLPNGLSFSTNSKEASINKVSHREFWDINGVESARITLSWNSYSRVDSLTNWNLNKLSIVGWDGSKWIKIPSQIDILSLRGLPSDINQGSISTISSFPPNNFIIYTLAEISFSQITLNINCPDSTINLNSAVVAGGIVPQGVVVSWHLGIPANNSNRVFDVNSVGEGIYYPAWFDSEKQCYGKSVGNSVLVIKDIPCPPTLSSTSSCGIGNITLTATNCDGTINWYEKKTDSMPIAVGGSLTITGLSISKLYYATCKHGSIESIKNTVLANIQALPIAEAIPVNPTCLATIVRPNGSIIASKFVDSDTYAYAVGNVFAASASTIYQAIPSNGILANTLSIDNSQNYTIRFLGNNGCWVDKTITLTNVCPDCPVGYCPPASITHTK